MKKAEMAQVIVQALRGYDELPSIDCARVRNMSRSTKSHLAEFYPKALEIIKKREQENYLRGKDWKDQMIQDQGLPVEETE